MGGGGSKMPPEPVERTKPGVALGGKPRLCFVGMRPSHHAGCAKKVFDLITETGAYETWVKYWERTFDMQGPYYDYVEELKKELPNAEKFAGRHGWSAPFVWLENPDGSRQAIGGRDDFFEWCKTTLPSKVSAAQYKKIAAKCTEAKWWHAYVTCVSKPGSTQVRLEGGPGSAPTKI